MTNGDVIRRKLYEMSDDELSVCVADFVMDNINSSEWYALDGKFPRERVLTWLGMESKEEDPDSVDMEWISVNESLPLLGVNVLVTRRRDNGVRYVRIASYQGDCWMDNTDEYMKPNQHPVIAWKSMPMAYCGKK